MSLDDDALAYHAVRRGKLAIAPKVALNDVRDLALAYTPHVAAPCREIARDPDLVDRYTSRGNFVAVVSDGSAVLGLGNIGPKAAMPVMEGKALLFKKFADVDAFPVCVESQDPDVIATVVRNLTPTFGGVNLEDIAAPKCFALEERLQAECDIPVFHDDQHGTAVVVLAALENAARALQRDVTSFRVVISGAGAAGIACARILLDRGLEDIVLLDSRGVISSGRPDLPPHKTAMAECTNPRDVAGGLVEALQDADVFLGVSGAGLVTPAMVRSMRDDCVVFAMANPNPEILPDDARAGGAAIVATGRSDYPNQINNVLGFPGIFRGALDVRASKITEGMNRAAARALAGLVSQRELRSGTVVPSPLAPGVAAAVALAVAQAAMREGVARSPRDLGELRAELQRLSAAPVHEG
jgi:malate dehydrogenase (oxaloacetate-decarboxylating)